MFSKTILTYSITIFISLLVFLEEANTRAIVRPFTDYTDPLSMSREQLMTYLDIDPAIEAETRRRFSQWTPDSKMNPDEIGLYYQGDMHFFRKRRRRFGYRDQRRHWDNGIVPYVIQPGRFNTTQIGIINRAIASFNSFLSGCIEWVPWQNEVDFVMFTTDMAGCMATTGKEGGMQVINLREEETGTCFSGGINNDGTGIIIHEMFHTMGVFHEQSRFDRDDYVRIIMENIDSRPLFRRQFAKFDLTERDPFGGGYDYGSIMHYSRTAFNINGFQNPLITIQPTKDPDAQIGQRVAPSGLDLVKLRNMYRCPSTNTPPPPQIVVEPFSNSGQLAVGPEVAIEPPRQPIKPAITGYKDPLSMTREDLMAYLDIDPAVEAETRRMVAQWRPESQINPDEVGRYYQGDMHFFRIRNKRYGLRDRRLHWPNGIVPYVIQPGRFNDNEEALINQAISTFNDRLAGCIQWVPRQTEASFVMFTSDMAGCAATVGRAPAGSMQVINLQGGNFCFANGIGTTLHEILHAVGVTHEHSRFDRDEYVLYLEQNVIPDEDLRRNGFDILPLSTHDPFGGGYDYESIMHYSRKAFTRDPSLDTLVPTKNASAEIGQRERISDLDLLKLRNMYGCPASPTPPPTEVVVEPPIAPNNQVAVQPQVASPVSFAELQPGNGIEHVVDIFRQPRSNDQNSAAELFDEIIIDVPGDVRFADPDTANKIAPMQIIIEQKTNAINPAVDEGGVQRRIRPVIRLRT